MGWVVTLSKQRRTTNSPTALEEGAEDKDGWLEALALIDGCDDSEDEAEAALLGVEDGPPAGSDDTEGCGLGE
jgi:hypothetical protein